jgi:two-component system chemotaxis response regulator CheB
VSADNDTKPGGAGRAGHHDAPHRDIVVVGGSAGALDPLKALVAGLPPDYPGAVLVVSHIGAHPSKLPELLSGSGPLPASHARTGDPLRPGHIYVAPPDCHMLIADGQIELTHGPREHFTRPAIDPLFRSAARAYGPRTIGIVLSGTGSDGAAGLEQIKRSGGLAIVQDPADALAQEMPETAAAIANPDYIVGSGEVAKLLIRLAAEPISPAAASSDKKARPGMPKLEHPIALTCPDCGGALRQADDTRLLTYRCHTGHRFSGTELLHHQNDEVEHAVVVAVRVLNERAELCRRMIDDARTSGRSLGVTYWTRLSSESEQELHVLQRFLTRSREEEGEQANGEHLELKAGE